MSDFLSKLYEEEMSKTGSSEFASIMKALPRDDLEAYLGIKMAADSHPPVEAPADDGKKTFKPGPAKPEAEHKDEEPETNLDKKAAEEHHIRFLAPKSKAERKTEHAGRAVGAGLGLAGGGLLGGVAARKALQHPSVVRELGHSTKGGRIGAAVAGALLGAGVGGLAGRGAGGSVGKSVGAVATPFSRKFDEGGEKRGSVQRVLDVMQKMAVAGPTIPQLPDAEGGHLQAKQNKIHRDVNAGNPQKVTVPVDHQGPAKGVTKEAMAWADSMGRELAAALQPDPSQELAIERAKIAMTAMSISQSVPEHIKTAAIAFAGAEVARVGRGRFTEEAAKKYL